MFIIFPFCWQCGTSDNPCNCKILGPTLGFLGGVVSAVVLYPAGAIMYPFNKQRGIKCFGLPSDILQKIQTIVPI